MKKILLVIAVMVSVATQAQSNTIAGIGTIKCKEYINEKNEDVKIYVTTWVQGFLTGMNIARVNKNLDSYVIPDVKEMNALLDLQCIRNKDDALFMRAAHMYFELTKAK